MRYTNKFVEFLNGANTIAITGARDFNQLKSLFNKVGLDFFKNLASFDSTESCYYDLLEVAMRNNCAINYSTILVEYQPYKGLSFGYHSFEESEKWYEKRPWTMKEIYNSMKGE